jgi:hypothetical protein
MTRSRYYWRRHARQVLGQRLHQLRRGVVTLQRRWLERQQWRAAALATLAAHAAAAARHRHARLAAHAALGRAAAEAAAEGRARCVFSGWA